jgi:hypothetical protein
MGYHSEAEQQEQEEEEDAGVATAAAVRAAAAAALAATADLAGSPGSVSPAASVKALALARGHLGAAAEAAAVEAAEAEAPAPAQEQPAPEEAEAACEQPAQEEEQAAPGPEAEPLARAPSSLAEAELEHFTSIASKLEDPWATRPPGGYRSPGAFRAHCKPGRGGKPLLLQQDSSRAGPALVWGFLFCLAMLGALSYRGDDQVLLQRAQQQPALALALAGLACLLALPFRSLLVCSLRTVLHFDDPQLERRYVVWFSAKQVFLDTAVHLVWLLVGSCLWLRERGLAAAAAAGGGGPLSGPLSLLLPVVPTAMLLSMRSGSYVQQRGKLLLVSRACITAALLYMQHAAPARVDGSLSLPAVTIAQLVTTVCMQVRLSSFLPLQAAHLLAVLATVRCASPLVFVVQLAAFGLCLPALLLFYLELFNRRAFAGSLQPGALLEARLRAGGPPASAGGEAQAPGKACPERPAGLVRRARSALVQALGN